MTAMYILTGILLGLFLLYTVGFIVQWILGLFTAIPVLGKVQSVKALTQYGITDEVMKKNPVSVLIPAYNEEACIVETIESLLDEDYLDLQIIVIDDGSKDATVDRILQKYPLTVTEIDDHAAIPTKRIRRCYRGKGPYSQITLICKENGGKADALNCGLNHCKSPYCVVMDADTQIQKGSLRVMLNEFLRDDTTVVCAGAVGSDKRMYSLKNIFRRALVCFQFLEYYRSFYMQRVFFNRRNANIVVAGAFAMFDADLVRQAGGYSPNTIGEDMELTMRLHAFCASQNRKYRIAYTPGAKCCTQFPSAYRDYYRQRRRWHIGMIQSMKNHRYMCGNRRYGWAGVMSGTLYALYELLTPFVELLGLFTLIAAHMLGMLNLLFALKMMLLYSGMVILMQMLLIACIDTYGVEKIEARDKMSLLLISAAEFVFFHQFNMAVKLVTFFTYRKNRATWGKIQRIENSRKPNPAA